MSDADFASLLDLEDEITSPGRSPPTSRQMYVDATARRLLLEQGQWQLEAIARGFRAALPPSLLRGVMLSVRQLPTLALTLAANLSPHPHPNPLTLALTPTPTLALSLVLTQTLTATPTLTRHASCARWCAAAPPTRQLTSHCAPSSAWSRTRSCASVRRCVTRCGRC